jgi:LmbE family N-acetylglucosaminyl deacetylase
MTTPQPIQEEREKKLLEALKAIESQCTQWLSWGTLEDYAIGEIEQMARDAIRTYRKEG